MIYCLTGELLYTDALSSMVVVDCGGVGYKVTVTSATLAKLPLPADMSQKPEKVRLFTYMQVREDAMELFGFSSAEELDTFKLLLTVSGVGPKAGMSVLSLFTPAKLAMAIQAEDIKAIAKAPNIGAKTASRIVLELKDKMAKLFPLGAISEEKETSTAAKTPRKGNKTSIADAEDALIVLGYTRTEVMGALRQVDTTKSTEEMIRLALQILMK